MCAVNFKLKSFQTELFQINWDYCIGLLLGVRPPVGRNGVREFSFWLWKSAEWWCVFLGVELRLVVLESLVTLEQSRKNVLENLNGSLSVSRWVLHRYHRHQSLDESWDLLFTAPALCPAAWAKSGAEIFLTQEQCLKKKPRCSSRARESIVLSWD